VQNPLTSLKETLSKTIKGSKRLAVLGVGSELRGDDIAGMIVAREILNLAKESDSLKVFLGETAPENLTGEIKKYKPTHLLIIDAGDMGKEPGSVALITPEEEIFGATFSTHKLPIKVLVKYLNESFPCKTFVLIIQPKDIGFGKDPSSEVKASSLSLARSILEAVK